MKHYYMRGLTKDRLEDIGAQRIIPATFSYSWGLVPGHTVDVTETDANYNALEWVFVADSETLLSIALITCKKPVEIPQEYFNALEMDIPVGVLIKSQLHEKLCLAKKVN